jgi:alcohol dehydrogenase class IV
MGHAVSFEFATAGRVIFGEGSVSGVPAMAASLGKRALVVTGRTPERYGTVLAGLASAGVACELFGIAGEPTVSAVREGIAAARGFRAEIVIGIGGGSVMDAAKAIAALVTNPGELMDHLEVIGGARPLELPSAPCMAVPTTAGTGSEVTRNAVITSAEHGVKVSLRGPFILPRVAVVDPELTLTLPPAVTAATGLDALTQLLEAFVCTRANPVTDALCRQGLRLAAGSLGRVYRDGSDREGRHDMSLAALLSGMALANAGLGAVHGMAAAIGGMFPAAPHGAVCAALLPGVVEANWQAVRGHGSDTDRSKFNETADLLTGQAGTSVGEAVEWLRSLAADCAIPGLAGYGIGESNLKEVAARALAASSMKANPVSLSGHDLEGILRAAL